MKARNSASLRELFPSVRSDFRVEDLVFDSRKVTPQSVFFALRGSQQDGHDHLEKALQAPALVVMDPARVPAAYGGEVIVVKDTRTALAQAAQRFFNFKNEDLVIFGVTGTNGKTTSVYMYEEMMKRLGQTTGVMGTIDHHVGPTVWRSQLTTPDVVGVYQRLGDFKAAGAKHAAMEISSHALDQRRIEGLRVDVGVWTNLTRDHLDYHRTEANYFAAKEKLFLDHIKEGGFALLNGDARNLRAARVAPAVKKYFFGAQGEFRFSEVKMSLKGLGFQFHTPFGAAAVEVATPGFHNVYNACGVLAAGLCLGYDLKKVATSLNRFYGAPGRLELVHQGPFVFVDYAHTPDALSSSLKSLRSLVGKDQKIIAVFGFGGDRDAGKRPLMVNEALPLADQIILTSDNPRSEDPLKILQDGIGEHDHLEGGKIKMEVDRRRGIHMALQMASPDDVILIAGKGHEDYQITGDQVLPFSDREVVREFFS